MLGWSSVVPAALLVAVVAVAAAPGARAQGTQDVLVYSNGANVQPGNQLIAGGHVTLTPSRGSIRTCSVDLRTRVDSNPLAPATASTTIGRLALSGCDASFAGLPYGMSISDAKGLPVEITSPSGVEIQLGVEAFCTYGTQSVSGAYSNAHSTMTVEATLIPLSNDAPCVRSLTLTAVIEPFRGEADGTGSVLVG